MLMRRLSIAVIAAVSTVALTQIASAADLPRKAPPAPPPPPVFSWTGFYVGLNAGATWGDADINWSASTTGFSSTGANAINTFGPGNIKKTGFIGGGQVGYNYQIANFVWGLEADINYTGLSGTRTVTNIPVFGTPNSITQTFESKWLATVRGRLGFSQGSWLIYGTGGLAVAQAKFSDNFTDPAGGVRASSSDTTRTGWTAGGGAEWAYSRQWSVKLEYLYVDLGHTSDSTTAIIFPTAVIVSDHHVTENIVRVGLNYHF